MNNGFILFLIPKPEVTQTGVSRSKMVRMLISLVNSLKRPRPSLLPSAPNLQLSHPLSRGWVRGPGNDKSGIKVSLKINVVVFDWHRCTLDTLKRTTHNVPRYLESGLWRWSPLQYSIFIVMKTSVLRVNLGTKMTPRYVGTLSEI